MKNSYLFAALLVFFLLNSIIIPQQKSIWDQVPEEIKKTNAFQRYQWFYRTRAFPNDTIPVYHQRAEKIKEVEKVEQNNSIEGTSDLWTNLGPTGMDSPPGGFIAHWGTVSGRVRGLAVHPTDPNTVYIGAAAGGIWKTTNGGTTWTDVSNGMNRLTFGAIAIDPGNTNTVYAGTGESRWFFNNVTFEGDGLYKSTDGGATWAHITNGFGSFTQFADIQVSPHNANIILAALGSGHWNAGNLSNEGIWRSSNGGTTWTRVNSNTDAFDVLFHPSNVNIVYATTGNNSSLGGFLVSTDQGVTWAQSNSGLPSATLIGRMQIALSLSNPLIIYSLIYNNATFPSGHTTVAYKSTDGGANWSQISAGVNIAGSYSGGVNDQGSYDLCLDVSPTSSNVVYFGNVEISGTFNGSNISFVRDVAGPYSGTSAWDSPMHVDYHKIVFAPSNGMIVYVASDGGIHRSTDGGLTYTSLNNGINTLQLYAMASDPNNENIMYAGAQDNGNFSTNDKGATNWNFENTGDGMECFVDRTNSNNVFISTQFGSLYRSTNAGLSWSSISPSYSYSRAWTAPYWQDPVNPNWIYVASQRILRSTNQGASWSALSGTLTSTNRITSVAQSSVNSQNMLATCSYYDSTPSLHKSTNGGATWTTITGNVTASFPAAMIHKIIAHPTNANTFYLARGTYGTGQILQTTDFGVTWTNISGNLPFVSHNDLFVDPANTNHLYVANDFGVYFSSDGGANWIKLSNGMPFLPVLDFDFWDNGSTRYLRAATHGRGVYELNIDNPLPVELVSFTSSIQDGSVLLSWSTATEINNYGFDIERSQDGSEFSKIDFIQGNGNSNSPKSYSYSDNSASGLVKYRLKQIDNDGTSSYSKVIEVDAPLVSSFNLDQNFPNPFNPSTRIKFALPTESNVKLVVTDLLGQEISVLVNESMNAGNHEAVWNPENVSSGIYFYTLSVTSKNNSPAFTNTKKMIYLE